MTERIHPRIRRTLLMACKDIQDRLVSDMGLLSSLLNPLIKYARKVDKCSTILPSGRLIIMRGKSKSGELYFYYLCRGRQARLGCDLPYFSVAKIEKAVAAHYATVRLPQDFCARATALMDDAVESKQATALQLRGSIEKELAELDIREDRYLDLYGEGDLPKAKLNERLKTVHDERAKLQRQLDALHGELETGRAILVSAMELLDDRGHSMRKPRHRPKKYSTRLSSASFASMTSATGRPSLATN